MLNFSYYNYTKLIFGKGEEENIAREINGKKVLLHYGGGSVKKTGLYDKITAALNESGVGFVELGGVMPNPRLSLVYEGIELCKKEGVDFILAVGGGSVIDSAKSIAAGVHYKGDVWDFFEGKPVENEILPIGVVLTIPAAGSESSGSCVVTKEEGLLKRYFGHENLRPKFAILNPELTFTLPFYQTACGISDIIAHIMERYFTNLSHVDLTDRLCEGAIVSIMENAIKVKADPQNYDARAEIMLAGTIAHNDSLGLGRDGDWASHDIEHELSAMYDIAHGAGLSIVFPAWMKYNYKININRFVQFAQRVMGVRISPTNPEEIVLEAINQLEKFYKQMGLPTRLSEVGIDSTHFKEMAKKAAPVGVFRNLNEEDIINIYKLAL